MTDPIYKGYRTGVTYGDGYKAVISHNRDDFVAAYVRAWYELNRETWWQRHFGSGPTDQFILDLIAEVHSAEMAVR